MPTLFWNLERFQLLGQLLGPFGHFGPIVVSNQRFVEKSCPKGNGNAMSQIFEKVFLIYSAISVLVSLTVYTSKRMSKFMSKDNFITTILI